MMAAFDCLELGAEQIMVELSYSHRPHALSAERRYWLEPESLACADRRRTRHIRYRDIEQLRVFKSRYLGSSATYWTCVLFPRSGGKIRLSAASHAGLRAVENRTATYIPFIKELEARIATANPNVQPVSGRHWLSALEAGGGRVVVGFIRFLRHFPLQRIANSAGWSLRKIGPRLRGHRTARAQVVAAFPEKTAPEIEQILAGMWDNIGRVAVEYAHLDQLWRYDPNDPAHSRIVMDPENHERCLRLQQDKQAALMFAAHLANWELPPHAAPAGGRKIALVYRSPNVSHVANELAQIRASCVAAIIPADRETPRRIREALNRGWMVGMLVDQYYGPGIDVTFFNRRCKINPLLARFARLFECPVHGSRVIRLPGGQFRFEVTDALALPRDADGKVDVAATMQMVTSMVESWVREYPEQWMWMHRRWR
jgi:KDO2-lipid IV(A) lauroyltransferase